MSEPLVLSSQVGAVRTITLNRPKSLNSFTSAMHVELAAALAEAEADTSVRCLVLTGAGRAFCPGMDTSTPRVLTPESRPELVRHGDDSIALFKLLARIDKPVIAAVHGYALGAGCSLPVGACATWQDGRLTLHAQVTSIEGTERVVADESAAPEQARELGLSVARTLKERGGVAILEKSYRGHYPSFKSL